MNFYIKKPYSILFTTTLLLGIFITLSSNNWVAIWLGLELNMYSFIPILLQSNLNQEKEAAIKYFLIQAIASAVLLLSMISFFSPLLLLYISLMIKLGLAPCHMWLPIIMSSLSWNMCWILTTLQKIAPLFLITQVISHKSSFFTSFIASLSSMIGAIGGMNQTQLRAILAYSSINHLGWLMASSLISSTSTLIYFFSYIMIVSSIILNLSFSQTFSNKPSILTPANSSMIMILLLSLGGLPPLFGFFPKMMILYSLIYSQTPMLLLSFILIISSSMSLYYYLKIIFNLNTLWLSSPLLQTNKLLTLKSPSILTPFLYTTSILFGLFLFMFYI